MYGLLIPTRHPPVPVCDEPRTDLPKPKESWAEVAPTPEPPSEPPPWPAPPRPLEREMDPEC